MSLELTLLIWSVGLTFIQMLVAVAGTILEFGLPATPGIRQLYGWYFRVVLPRLGRLISRHREAYSYLPASVELFPSGQAFADLLRRGGFAEVSHRALTAGVVSLYLAK